MSVAEGRVRDDARLREARQLRLIDATIESIARNGLAATTLARVGEIAGYSPGTVHFHFDSKDALLLATLTHVATEFESAWRRALGSAGDEPAARLRALVDELFAPERFDSRRAAVWDAFWGEARAREDYLRVCGESDRAWYGELRSLVGALVAAGDRRSVDADAVAQALGALFDTLPQQALVADGAFDPDRARATCLGFLASVFPQAFAPTATGGDALPASNAGGAHPVATTAPTVRETVDATDTGVAIDTLPGWVYHNAEFHELEKEYLFRRQWLLVGHVNEMREPGDYLTLDVADERVMVVRGDDGQLQGLHNVCRHRASRVVEGESGNCGTVMVCPYHGWAYNLDGSLRGVPAASTFTRVDPSRCALPRVDVEVCLGFVFVRIARDHGPSVAARLEPLLDELRPYRLEELVPYDQPWSDAMDVDWKCVHDNDNEGYHVPLGHPGLNRIYARYDDHALGNGVSRSFAPLREELSSGWSESLYQRLLPRAPHLPESHQRAWLYFGMFPNTSVGVYPDMVGFFQALPLAPGRCVVRARTYALPDERREMRIARYLNQRINRQVWREDLNFCVWTNEGLRSSAYPGGPLSSKEGIVQQFHDTVRTLIPVARHRQAPPPGRVAELNEQALVGPSAVS